MRQDMCPQEKSRRREINELAALMRQVMWPKTTIYLSCDNKGQVAGHPGTFPGVSSQLLMFLGTGHTFVVLSNYSRGREPVVKKLASLILELERGSQLPPEFRKRLTN